MLLFYYGEYHCHKEICIVFYKVLYLMSLVIYCANVGYISCFYGMSAVSFHDGVPLASLSDALMLSDRDRSLASGQYQVSWYPYQYVS